MGMQVTEAHKISPIRLLIIRDEGPTRFAGACADDDNLKRGGNNLTLMAVDVFALCMNGEILSF